jgi:hypothetical protein
MVRNYLPDMHVPLLLDRAITAKFQITLLVLISEKCQRSTPKKTSLWRIILGY